MSPSFGFGHDELDLAVRELASELSGRGVTVDLHVVGGAAVVLSGVGRAYLTADVDASVSDPDVRRSVMECADAVRSRHPTWPDDWLNDDAARLFPPGGPRRWRTHHSEGGVRVMLANPEMLLAMKLRAARPGKDRDDVEALLSHCRIRDEDAAARLFETYWPGDLMGGRAQEWVSTALSSNDDVREAD